MPWNRKLYPKNWEEIAYGIKQAAGWKCQECGKECRRPGETLFDLINRQVGGNWRDNAELAWDLTEHPTKWVLTVAHLNHRPEDCRPENLRALCAPCHCRYDLAAMAQKRYLKLEREGQLSLFGGGTDA